MQLQLDQACLSGGALVRSQSSSEQLAKKGEDRDEDNHSTKSGSSDADDNRSPDLLVGRCENVPAIGPATQPGRCKLAVALTWLTTLPFTQPAVQRVVQSSSIRMVPDHADAPSCAAAPSETTCSVPSMRELHAANTRNRRISIVAALSPQDLKAWQACGNARAGFERSTMAAAPAQSHVDLASAAGDGANTSLSPEGSKSTSTKTEAKVSATSAPRSDTHNGISSLRELHAANTRNRRLGLVAALSPDDLRAWQADSVRAAIR